MATICETAASLRVIGDELDPDEVTRLLAGDPDNAQRKGAVIQMSGESQRIAQTGIWRKKVERRCPGDLDGQIVKLLTDLTDDLEAWAHLSEDCRVEFFCGLFMENGNEGIRLKSETIMMLAERHIALDFDIYAAEPGI
ncbi:DUF4279 domain-containing protein [Parasedimentitalea marina]|uniref:DUF4279 domain-containing protein n=2 Tax=Parasedimentitalea marina TaxID=2483033 RepID=A0A3T0N608_9RHOB|nr:DUF4279 domain-containing protein [Parasedimentitalea marina]